MEIKSGLLLSPPDTRDWIASSVLPRVVVPEKIRLDHLITDIRDQGFWPTCVGKAAAGIMSAEFKKKLSAIYIYAKCKEIDGIPNIPGTYPRVAMSIMKNYGCCTEKLLPYHLMDIPLPTITDEHNLDAARRKIKGYARAYSIAEIKQALANKNFLVGVLLVGDNFAFHQGSGVIGLPQGKTHGYHAVIVCGADDEYKAIRIANSWGAKAWGEGGFAWLSYDYIPILKYWPEAWVVDVEIGKVKWITRGARRNKWKAVA